MLQEQSPPPGLHPDLVQFRQRTKTQYIKLVEGCASVPQEETKGLECKVRRWVDLGGGADYRTTGRVRERCISRDCGHGGSSSCITPPLDDQWLHELGIFKVVHRWAGLGLASDAPSSSTEELLCILSERKGKAIRRLRKFIKNNDAPESDLPSGELSSLPPSSPPLSSDEHDVATEAEMSDIETEHRDRHRDRHRVRHVRRTLILHHQTRSDIENASTACVPSSSRPGTPPNRRPALCRQGAIKLPRISASPPIPIPTSSKVTTDAFKKAGFKRKRGPTDQERQHLPRKRKTFRSSGSLVIDLTNIPEDDDDVPPVVNKGKGKAKEVVDLTAEED
ncbi:hypothetical protein PQX77_015111 [Marasmius sp. AFHP31]|nr:hypothetical protein PQX77_022173 [Marasmius sp. AFHP31]KAK1222080.1 hypothetical protein PQX77_015111 [Marasmius sp. AFHP31]